MVRNDFTQLNSSFKDSMPESKLESLFLIPPNDKRGTFDEDERLPNLPLPDLKHTLERYLDSIKPLVTPEELQNTAQIVQRFENGVGRRLNEKLKWKARQERNWVEKWWEDLAYLRVREPLLPFCSMDGVLPKDIAGLSYGSRDDQIKHASLMGYYLVQFWDLLRREVIKPTQTADKKTTFSMSQFRRLYNTVRIPGEEVDSLSSYFKTAKEGSCPSTVIVICRGKIFSFDPVDEKGAILTPPDWEKYLWEISDYCNKNCKNETGVGILTCDTRTNWSKNRKYLESLSKRNKENLNVVEKSMFVLVLDDHAPDTDSEVTTCNLCGNYNNRWADKSMMMIYYKNGRSGAVADHTAFDGIASITCQLYAVTAVEECKGTWKGNRSNRSLPKATEINFDVDNYLEKEIHRLNYTTIENKNKVLMTRRIFEEYGKSEIQKFKLHPDTFIQMSIQLAYYRIHGQPAPCYETATTRGYYNGRTETLRSCTTDCVDWVKSMLNDQVSNEEKKRLLEKAVKRHDDLMSEARENAGCDRHLFGLYCTALEEGIEIPELFTDPSYYKSGGGGNFVLSTSCTGYTSLGGGVAPMCKNGYGVFYNILPNKVHFTVSVNTESTETDAFKYFESLKLSLRQMRQVLLDASRTVSKL